VGKGRQAPYQRLARKVSAAEVVRFEGLRADVERCYAGADLFVLPTLYDPFANTCLEAMACGLPVLTTAVNGATELMRDGINGCVLGDTPSPETVADALQRLLSWERRRGMGEAAQQVAGDYPLTSLRMRATPCHSHREGWARPGTEGMSSLDGGCTASDGPREVRPACRCNVPTGT
jgi:glycosyltransferase involved in cell wall biosynthesis